jgi:hypothetical protein
MKAPVVTITRRHRAILLAVEMNVSFDLERCWVELLELGLAGLVLISRLPNGQASVDGLTDAGCAALAAARKPCPG